MRSLLAALLEVLFGCRHRNTAWPISRRIGGKVKPPYIVCLDCGTEIAYDWHSMQALHAAPVQTSGTKRVVKQRKIEARLEG